MYKNKRDIMLNKNIIILAVINIFIINFSGCGGDSQQVANNFTTNENSQGNSQGSHNSNNNEAQSNWDSSKWNELKWQ